MDANNFVMSSYQFVNSLASCYPNNTNTSSNSTSSNGPQNDYFPASAYNPNLYSGAPQSHYPNPQGYNPLSATAQSQQPGSAEMVDYTQLQPQKFMLNQQQQQALGQASCKYAGDASGQGNATSNINQTSISSPQDLSTARDISPKLSPSSVVDTVASRTMNKQHSTNNNNNSIANNNSKSNNNTTNNSHLQSTSLPMRSPDGDESDASSDSGTEGGSGTGNGKKSKSLKLQAAYYAISPHYHDCNHFHLLLKIDSSA
jgi:Antp family protein